MHPSMRPRVLPVKLAIDVPHMDLSDRDLASGSDLMSVAVSIWLSCMDRVFTIVVLYTVLSGLFESLELEGSSWAMSWVFLQRCLTRWPNGMARSISGGMMINVILGLPFPRMIVTMTAIR